MTDARPTPATNRSIAVTAAGIMLIILAILYAGVAALFAFQASRPGQRIRIGEFLPPYGLGYDAMSLFLVLFALCAGAGLAAIERWRAWRLLVGLAAWATIGLAAFVAWFRLEGGLAGLPLGTPAGVVAIAVLALLSVGERTPNASAPRRSYFARHWHGELTLPESYWRNGLAGGLLLAIIEYVAAEPMLLSGSFHLLAPMLTSFIIVNAAFLTWLGVGIWRAANRYRGSRIWSILAKATVVIGWSSFVLRSGLLLAAITGVLGRAR